MRRKEGRENDSVDNLPGSEDNGEDSVDLAHLESEIQLALERHQACSTAGDSRRAVDDLVHLLTIQQLRLTKVVYGHINKEERLLKQIHEIMLSAKITLRIIKIFAVVAGSMAASWEFVVKHVHFK